MYNQTNTDNGYYFFNEFNSYPASVFEDFSEFLENERLSDPSSKSYQDVINQAKETKNKEVRYENLL